MVYYVWFIMSGVKNNNFIIYTWYNIQEISEEEILGVFFGNILFVIFT